MLNLRERAAEAREKRNPRAQISQMLRENGIPASLAGEITERGMQAAFKAMDTLMETPDRSPDFMVKVNALNVARGVIAAELAVLDDVISLVNSELGTPSVNVVIAGGWHG